MERKLTIDGFTISDDSECFIIAEIGHNHQGDLEKAKDLFKTAKECGVNAVKLQKRDNKTLFTKAAYNRPYDHRNSFGLTYGAHRVYLEFGKKETVPMKSNFKVFVHHNEESFQDFLGFFF